MANNYVQTSCLLKVPAEKLEQARTVVTKCLQEIENDEDNYTGFDISFEDDGIWFNGEECANADGIAFIAQSVLDELEINEPFVFSWAYTCSKPRLDEFGGGACALKRGQEPFFVDAYSLAYDHFKTEK